MNISTTGRMGYHGYTYNSYRECKQRVYTDVHSVVIRDHSLHTTVARRQATPGTRKEVMTSSGLRWQRRTDGGGRARTCRGEAAAVGGGAVVLRRLPNRANVCDAPSSWMAWWRA